MKNLQLISSCDGNYFFSSGSLFGQENNVFYKIDLNTLTKTPISFGGVVFTLFNGKIFYYVDNVFSIKEQVWKQKLKIS